MSPTVTVLITTYNRCRLLPRAIASVLRQDFADFEIIIIDDASQDATPDVVNTFADPRIRYIRNQTNQGAKFGDRGHVRRCIYELMRGKYFIYLCDDDFWLPNDLLSRQVAAFAKYPTLAMVVGGHAHTYPAPLNRLPKSLYYTLEPVEQVSPTTFHAHRVFPAGFLSKYRYLELFATDPFTRNLLDGATLFSRQALIKGGVFSSATGSTWQAGYEFKIGPTMTGDVFYIDEPCVIAAVDATNASFRGTQRQHYLDCIVAVDTAFNNVAPTLSPKDLEFLQRIRKKFIHQISILFLFNKMGYRLGWFKDNPVDHRAMFLENVTVRLVARVFREHQIPFSAGNIATFALSVMPGWSLRLGMQMLRGWDAVVRGTLPGKRRLHMALRTAPAELDVGKE